MDQSAARVMVAGGPVTMDQSGAVVLVAQNVQAEKASGIVFLIARNVEGNVTAAFGPRESVLFGAVTGLVGGVVIFLASLIRRKRGRK
jgi:hypothetical protein